MKLAFGSFKVLCQHLEGLNKIMTKLSQVVWSPCRDMKLGLLEYETATVTTLQCIKYHQAQSQSIVIHGIQLKSNAHFVSPCKIKIINRSSTTTPFNLLTMFMVYLKLLLASRAMWYQVHTRMMHKLERMYKEVVVA